MPVAKTKDALPLVDGGNKLKQQRQSQIFHTYQDISSAFQAKDEGILVENLTALRNNLSIRPQENAIQPQDTRLLLAQQWLENDAGAHDIFRIWDGTAHRPNPAVAPLLVAILSSLLTLLSSHYTFHGLGLPIVKAILAPTYQRRLNSYLGGAHNELILVTLKLYITLSNFAGGREKKAVLDAFGWEIKSLPKLLNMRRKSSARNLPSSTALEKPDIRTLYIMFMMSFVDSRSPSQVKSTFIEQHQNSFLSIFKGLIQDSFHVIRLILEECWTGIWSDPKVKRTLKISLFNETTISHLVKLYDRNVTEDENDDDPDHIPADLVHHFLLAICTRPGVGVCFKDRGWYPRELDADAEVHASSTESHTRPTARGSVHNKILSNVLKTLRVNEDPREQELALKIMNACPELVSGYWSGVALTLEPRLSSKWITNIAFFGSVISLPVPLSSFYLPNSNLHHPTPPPLNSMIENIFPSVNTKINFSRGLQSPSSLVRHCTAVALARCLGKYEQVLEAFKEIGITLEENETDGLWCKRRRDLEREARKRVPEFQVIISFSQQHKTPEGPINPAVAAAEPQPVRDALLSEIAQRLLWMYHRSLSSLVTQVRFDVGKLLQNFVTSGRSEKTHTSQSSNNTTGLHALRQLHILRLLKDSDQFAWTGSYKTGTTSQSYLAVLLNAYAVSEDHSALRVVLSSLLEHILSGSILFQQDPSEPWLWLLSLPILQRGRGTESPDGGLLSDEVNAIITFLDDCVQRCLKTPYRYIEDMQSLANNNDAIDVEYSVIDMLPSPLLMTVLEQFDIKVGKRLLSPSDTLALASFVRKLGFRLSSKQQDLGFLRAVAAKFDATLHADRLFPEFLVITTAIRREVDFMSNYLSPSTITLPPQQHSYEQIGSFLSAVEEMPTFTSKADCKTAASELVDWLRLVEDVLGTEEIARLLSLISKLYPPYLPLIVEHAAPVNGSVWQAFGPASRLQGLPFDFLFLHASETQIADEPCREILAAQALGHEPNLADAKRAVCLISHRFMHCTDVQKRGLLLLLASIMKRSRTLFQLQSYNALKEVVFARSPAIKSGFVAEYLSNDVCGGFLQLIGDALDPLDMSDRMLIAETSSHWLDVLSSNVAGAPIQNPLAFVWLRYFRLEDLFSVLDTLSSTLEISSSHSLVMLDHVLTAVKTLVKSKLGSESGLIQRLPMLMDLQSRLAGLTVLEELIAMAIESSIPAFCDGHPHNEAFDDMNVHDIIKRSEVQWSQRSDHSGESLSASPFLAQDSWTPSTITIISSLIYKAYLPTGEFISWINTEHCSSCPSEFYVILMHAFLDTSLCLGKVSSTDDQIWISQLSRLLRVIQDDGLAQDTRAIGATCISLMMELVPMRIPDFVSTMVRAVQALSGSRINPEMLSVGRRLHESFANDATRLVEELASHGIQCIVRLLAVEDILSLFDAVVDDLAFLVDVASAIKSHLAEPVVEVVIQNHLAYIPAVKLITALFSSVRLKPVVVNRYLQSILQHTDFFKLCVEAPSGASSIRNAVVNLLHVVFHLHPANTCQVTHLEPLVRIYYGSLSQPDGQILSIFRLFETERKVSIASLLNRWSPSVNVLSAGPLEAVQSLDSILVLRTCLNFPSWRRIQNVTTKQATPSEAQLYDPIFLLLLFAQMLAEKPPESAFAWVELFRTNVVGFLIRAMSSKDGAIRDIALCQITGLWQCLETADLQERPHVLHILGLLKNVFPPPSDEAPRRLPSYTTLLLLHALRGVFHPSNFTYPITSRFLLQRPELDLNDVPMLYSMLYGSSSDWKKERGWMIRFLADGMMSADDWRVLKGRHTWDLLASMFQSSEDDRVLRAGIFEVLANLTCNAQATASLVLKSGLLSWIEMQLLRLKRTDALEWIKILNNIMIIANFEKFEFSTNGEWRAAICRCLSMLLDGSSSPNAFTNLLLIAQATLRLSLFAGPRLPNLPLLLQDSVRSLKHLEANVTIPATFVGTGTPSSDRLHRAREIHDSTQFDDLLQVWGVVVEILWRISMSLEEVSDSWDALSCRMLVWGAFSRGNGSLPRWVRTQVICNIASNS